jgi:hypothetical protein
MSKAKELADAICRIDTLTKYQRELIAQAAAELRRLAAVEKNTKKLGDKIECQYAKDVGMNNFQCVGKCQYEALARAVMSDNTGVA